MFFLTPGLSLILLYIFLSYLISRAMVLEPLAHDLINRPDRVCVPHLPATYSGTMVSPLQIHAGW